MSLREKLRISQAILALGFVMATGLEVPAWGMGQEVVGNETLPAQGEYLEGLMPVVNDRHRIYYSWVNGNEHFYYQGSTNELNEALKLFALIDAPEHEVVLLPGPGQAKRFDGKPMDCDWMLHFVGGIAKRMTDKAGDEGVWDKHPTLTVYASGGRIDLESLQIPRDVMVVTPDDRKARYLKGLASTDKETRGQAASFLVDVDPFNVDTATSIKALLNDEDSYVRAYAASSLARMGKVAEGALPALRECLKNGDRYTESYQRAIDKISQAPDPASDAEEYDKAAKRIEEFARSFRSTEKPKTRVDKEQPAAKTM